MKRLRFLSLTVIFVVVILLGCTNNDRSGIDMVPDSETAIKIAEAVWLPLYGEGIYDEKPFIAELVGKVWIVKGTLPEGKVGGVVEIEISKEDGKIIRVTHGK